MMDEKVVSNTEPIQQMLQRLGASAVFGEPTTQNGVVVIPVAQTQFGFGYGGGYGSNGKEHTTEDVTANETGEGAASGGGSGGGASARSTPLGFIRVSSEGVKFEPITDETRIPLAGILMVAWVVFWVMATIRVIAKAVAKSQQAKWKAAKEESAT